LGLQDIYDNAGWGTILGFSKKSGVASTFNGGIFLSNLRTYLMGPDFNGYLGNAEDRFDHGIKMINLLRENTKIKERILNYK